MCNKINSNKILDLSFNLHVYFATYYHRPEIKRVYNGKISKLSFDRKNAMKYFDTYLDANSKLLSQYPEYLVYFSLSRIPNPVDNPSFSVYIYYYYRKYLLMNGMIQLKNNYMIL